MKFTIYKGEKQFSFSNIMIIIVYSIQHFCAHDNIRKFFCLLRKIECIRKKLSHISFTKCLIDKIDISLLFEATVYPEGA